MSPGSPFPVVPTFPCLSSPSPATLPPMRKIEQIHKELEEFLDKLGIPKEPPKGSFYDLSSDEEEEPKRKRGAQPGNQNARKHGFYSKHLTPDQMKQLEEADDLRDLGPEIALLRVKLNTLLDDPDVSLELILRAVNSLARLMSIQRRYVYG